MYENLRTSDNYEPIVVFLPNGKERHASVLQGRAMPLDAARDGLGSGQMVWVAPGDAAALREWREGRGR